MNPIFNTTPLNLTPEQERKTMEQAMEALKRNREDFSKYRAEAVTFWHPEPKEKTMSKLAAIEHTKQLRKDGDALLQKLKDGYPQDFNTFKDALDGHQVIRHHQLSVNALEDCIMRLGMVLKYIGNPNPYPSSYDPASPVVEPTADGLKM